MSLGKDDIRIFFKNEQHTSARLYKVLEQNSNHELMTTNVRIIYIQALKTV